jgi:hypothetical protein
MSFDIGPMANLAEARPLGFKTAEHALAPLATAGAEALYLRHMRKNPAKDYNDQPASTTVGSSGGQAVKEAPHPDWVKQHPGWMPEP